MRYFSLLLLLMTAMLTVACSETANFSQRDGFAEIRAALTDIPPTAAEQALLRRYQPDLYLDPQAETPMDFYQDYIAHGELSAGGQRIANPSPMDLNDHKNDPLAAFRHIPPPRNAGATTPLAYGGVSRATVDWPLVGRQNLTFLSYHFVFRSSGLPAGISPTKKFLANLVGDSRDWHQLDHYTAAFVVLIDELPVAVILQHHNYMRTYLLGDEDFPDGNTIALDAAISSNELYPHRPERTHWRAVGFISADAVDYLLGLQEAEDFNHATDITNGQRRLPYRLTFLPPGDAFYVFEGWLGERRRLPGRDGPPGAIYRNLPTMWHLPIAMAAFYWQPQDRDYAELIHRGDVWQMPEPLLKQLQQRLAKALISHHPHLATKVPAN